MKPSLLSLTPQEFEVEVRRILDGSGESLDEYQSKNLETIQASDGGYVLDVTARFSALGASCLVLVECKHQQRNVERSEVQQLHSKVQSIGAQKGMLFSISGFQSGAIEYATSHGIALVQLQDECTTYFARSHGHPGFSPTGRIIGWLYHGTSMAVVSSAEGCYMKEELARETTEWPGTSVTK
jgi:restriction system protein